MTWESLLAAAGCVLLGVLAGAAGRRRHAEQEGYRRGCEAGSRAAYLAGVRDGQEEEGRFAEMQRTHDLTLWPAIARARGVAGQTEGRRRV